jgi:hypothetical protein
MNVNRLKTYALGGGRTLSANATKWCLEETGSAWNVNTGEKGVFSRFVLAFGAAEWAATQTVHLAVSDALE